MENLRFGYLTVDVDDVTIAKFIGKNMNEMGIGDGEKLGGYLIWMTLPWNRTAA